MIVTHKNSREEYDLSDIVYDKFNGQYGYLVLTLTKEIYFFVGNEEGIESYNMTSDFDL
jgi:hypothetical protein